MHMHPAVEATRDLMLALLDAGPAAELGEPERAIIAAIVTGPLAYLPLMKPEHAKVRARLAATLKLLRIDDDSARTWLAGLVSRHDQGEVDRLVAAGWLVAWQPTQDVAFITLSPLAADRIGIELIDAGPGDTPEPRWSVRNPDPPPIRVPKFAAGTPRQLWIDTLADQRPGPLELAIIAEEFTLNEGKEPVLDTRFADKIKQLVVLTCPVYREKRKAKKKPAKVKVKAKKKARKEAKKRAKLQRKVTAEVAPKQKPAPKAQPQPQPQPQPAPPPRPSSFDLKALRTNLETA